MVPLGLSSETAIELDYINPSNIVNKKIKNKEKEILFQFCAFLILIASISTITLSTHKKCSMLVTCFKKTVFNS